MRSLLLKRGLWRTYLFSFIAVFLACNIIVISSFYILVDKLLKDEVAQFSINMANQVKDAVDMRIEELYDLSYQISLEKRPKSFIYVKRPFDIDGLLAIPELIDMLSVYRAANSFISYIAIYYPNNNSVITSDGCYEEDAFFEDYAVFKGISKDDLLGPHYKNILTQLSIRGQNKLNGEYIAHIQSLPVEDGISEAVIMIFVNKNSLLSMMASHMSEDIGQVKVFTSDGKLIVSKEEQNLLDSRLVNSMKGAKKTFYVEDGNKVKNVASYTVSQSTNWYYVVVLSLKYSVERVKHIRNLIIVIVFVGCIVGSAMSLLMTRYNYRPWKSLMKDVENLSTKSAFEANENEYLYVRDTIKAILNEREKIQSVFEKNKKYARHYILQKLCDGESISKEDLHYNKIELSYECFNVAVMKVKEEIERLHAAFASIISEVHNMHEGYKIFSFYDRNGILYFIINMDRRYTEENVLTELIGELRKIVKEIIVDPIAFGVGNIYDNIDGISVSCQEAKKALEYSVLSEDDCIMQYKELPELSSKILDLPVEFRNKLYTFVKNGDYKSASGILDLSFSKLTNQNTLSVSDVYYLYYNLLSVAIQVCNDMHINIEDGCRQKKDRLFDVICEHGNVKQVVENLYKVYSCLCDYILMENREDKELLCEQIKQYVQENFMNEELCSAEIAGKLSISISYLSRYMNKTFGMGFGDYLNKVRLDKAKSLLKNSSKTVNEIANEVGYTSTSSFIRTFKRLEGITPGQYKDIL